MKRELVRYEKSVLAKTAPKAEKPALEKPLTQSGPPIRTRELVAGGDIKWKPVDRSAAMLLAKSPWWAKPVDPPKTKIEQPKKTKKQRNKMSNGYINTTQVSLKDDGRIPANCEYTSAMGLKIKVVNGEHMINVDDMDRFIMDQIAKLPMETRPNVLAAQDARKIIHELLQGLGGDMEKFQANVKLYLTDIRQTRFAVVAEVAAMTKELKDVRQFFLGQDYTEQVTRLKEFVDLCERLSRLKESGFLDKVADTMLRLA